MINRWKSKIVDHSQIYDNSFYRKISQTLSGIFYKLIREVWLKNIKFMVIYKNYLMLSIYVLLIFL